MEVSFFWGGSSGDDLGMKTKPIQNDLDESDKLPPPENQHVPCKNGGWKTTFLLKWLLCRGHGSFQGRKELQKVGNVFFNCWFFGLFEGKNH